MRRLTQLPTLRVNPAEPTAFIYRGKTCQGLAGDTVATALFANDVRVFGRSLKYHRPRGLYSLDGECSNTMMAVDGIPNVRTESMALKAGMVVEAQNVKWTPENDMMGFIDKLDWAMPAGFYYRSMHKPARIWPIALKQVRKAAGLGVMKPDFQMPGKYEEIYPTADVCIIGGGPAGMWAALSAASHGLRVILLESRPFLGGFFEYRSAAYENGTPLYRRARDLADRLGESENVRVLTRTTVIGTYINNVVTAFQVGEEKDPFAERYMEIRAKSVVVATGCIERPLLFENNERPGVMQIGCAHRLAHTYGLLPGKTAVFSVGHDLGLETAADLFDVGAAVACVADIRQDGQDPGLVEALAKRKIPLLRGWVAAEAHGKTQVDRVTISTIQGTANRDMECDLLVASAGLTPLTGPLTTAQGRLSFDHHTGFFLPVALPPNMHAAGRLLGLHDPRAVEASGQRAGFLAAVDCGAPGREGVREAEAALREHPGPQRGCKLAMAPVKGRKTFVCFDEDATVKNIRQAMEMGFDAPELIKRFTAAGTGPGQGGIPGHNLPLLVSQLSTDPTAEAQPTTVRAPLVPVYLATCAGTNHDMCKRTPLHDSQKKAGGIMRRVGVWERARYFSQDFSCRQEIENVRNNVGMLDASTLGKFRLWGPDALKALQRVYVGDMSRIAQGKIKYSAMCNDDGCIVDDGVVVKRGENEYYLTTSTGRAGQTIEWLRYHTRYDGWDFKMVNLTDFFGVINLAGPNSRKVLQKVTEADVGNEALPFAGYREFTIREKIPARVMRLGFVGELSYEFHVPASYLQALWDVLAEAGKEFGIRNFGLEAQNVLRMEKGHLIIGSESEQRTTLHDVGLGFLWARNKPEEKTVGAAALMHTEKQEGRLKLVGFEMEQPGETPRDGSLVVDNRIRGYICVARYSFALKKSIGMALVDEPLAREGNRLEIFEDGCDGKRKYAQVIAYPFYDPEGSRMKI